MLISTTIRKTVSDICEENILSLINGFVLCTNSHFQYISVPFELISLINFFSLVLPRGWGFRAFFAREFLPQGPGFCSLFCLGRGWGFRPSKKFPGGRPVGMLTAGLTDTLRIDNS